jgi:hypothetical protein
MRAARNAIIEDRFALFVHGFFARYYEDKPVPSWATDALAVVGINLKQQAAGSLPD